MKIVQLPHESAYLALSYVWGQMPHEPRPFEHQGQPYFNHETLPLTIKQAIELTVLVGKRYLWIDRLCLSDSDPEQLPIMLSSMGAIYNRAYLTIVAASGRGAEAGLAGWNGSRKRFDLPCIEFESHGERLVVDAPSDDPFMRTGRSMWATRGWTYQEWRLSKRSVVFTDEEVSFDCQHTRMRERYAAVRSHIEMREHMAPLQSLTHARDHYAGDVGWFTMRDLSFPGDRLDAFSGILHAIYLPEIDHTQTKVLSGLPFHEFQQALCWQAENSLHTSSRLRIPTDTRQRSMLPSWSWVGWSGHIGGFFADFDSSAERPQILDDRNVLLAISPSPDLSAVDATARTAMYTPVLHLWTHCLRVKIGKEAWPSADQRDIRYFDQMDDSNYVIGLSAISHSVDLQMQFPEIDSRDIHLAHVFTGTNVCTNYLNAWWMIIAGELRSAERVGLALFKENEHEKLMKYAHNAYIRVF